MYDIITSVVEEALHLIADRAVGQRGSYIDPNIFHYDSGRYSYEAVALGQYHTFGLGCRARAVSSLSVRLRNR